jgi:hypothetical protein
MRKTLPPPNYDPITGLIDRKPRSGSAYFAKNRGGYFTFSLNGKTERIHRYAFFAMTGAWPPNDVDHINGIQTDNRWENLRMATRTENGRNQKRHCTNTSGYVGVRWHKAGRKWIAQIMVNKKNIHLGSFEDKDEAIAVRKAAEIKYNFHENHGRVMPEK